LIIKLEPLFTNVKCFGNCWCLPSHSVHHH